MTIADTEMRTCPSTSCTEGNLLIGIIRPDGTVAPVRPPLKLDPSFVRRAENGDRAPESRLRFAGPCITTQCHHWQDQRCGVADLVADSAEARVSTAGPLPPCAIRPTCRWWAQRGMSACRICPEIVHTRTPLPIFESSEGSAPP